MAETLEIQAKQDYLNVSFIGEFSVEASKRTIDRILQACSEYDQSVVLLDCLSMTGNLPIIDRYQVAVYGQRMAGKVFKLALVRRQEKAPVDLFTETVARNRGINLKMFTSIEQALDWLRA